MRDEMDEYPDLIIHDQCGLPVEFCECMGAAVVYDSELDAFIDTTEST